MIDRWRKLSAAERLKRQVFIASAIVAIYGLVFYPLAYKKLSEADKMLNRRRDRISKRADISKIGNDAPSPKALQSKIDETEKKIEAFSLEFEDLDSGFAPVDSKEVRQELLFEIYNLAERTGVEILSASEKPAAAKTADNAVARSVNRRGRAAAASAAAAAAAAVAAAVAKPPEADTGRPALLLRANAPFGQMLRFIRGLEDLSYYAAVMNLKLYVTPPGGSGTRGARGAAQAGGDSGGLYASLEVSI